jgi:hypothetical protein
MSSAFAFVWLYSVRPILLAMDLTARRRHKTNPLSYKHSFSGKDFA